MTKFQVNDKFVLSTLLNCFVLVGYVIEGDESTIKAGEYLKYNNKFFQIKNIGFLNAEGKNKYASALVVEYHSERDENMLTNLVLSETIFEVVEKISIEENEKKI